VATGGAPVPVLLLDISAGYIMVVMNGLDLAILGLLHEQELHGYEIRRRLRDDLGLFANISFGSLYPALSRLERAGLVVTATDEVRAGRAAIPLTGSLGGERAVLRARRTSGGRAPASRRSRKVYRITEAGRAQFARLLEDPAQAATDDDHGFGLRLAFARHLSPGARLGLLERRRAQLAERLAAETARAGGTGLDAYTRSLAQHASEATERDISWLDHLIEVERLGLGDTTASHTPAPDPATTKGSNP
jgi:DNA-binding PadR family transcriptional regulator